MISISHIRGEFFFVFFLLYSISLYLPIVSTVNVTCSYTFYTILFKYFVYLKQKDNKNFVSLQPANLYGEGDNFDLK